MLNHIIISKVHCLHIFNHCSALLAIVLGIWSKQLEEDQL